MKTVDYSLLILSVGGLGIAGYLLLTVATERETGLVIEQSLFDCGEVSTGEVCDVVFRFTNHSAKLIELGNAWSGCSCSQPQLTHQQLAPGETGTLKVRWSTRGLRGTAETLFWFRYRVIGEGYQETLLVAKAIAIPTINIHPAAIQFDPETIGRVRVTLDDLTHRDSDQPLIRKVTSSHEAFTVEELASKSFTLVYDPKSQHLRGSMDYITVETRRETERHIRIPVTFTAPLP